MQISNMIFLPRENDKNILISLGVSVIDVADRNLALYRNCRAISVLFSNEKSNSRRSFSVPKLNHINVDV